LVYLQPILRNPPPKATEFGEITRRLGLSRRSRSSTQRSPKFGRPTSGSSLHAISY